MSYQITGDVLKVHAKEQITEKFAKRGIRIITENGQYPQTIEIEFSNKGCDFLNNYKSGDRVTIDFDLRGNVTKDGRCFTKVSGFKIRKADGNAMQPDNDWNPNQDDDLAF